MTKTASIPTCPLCACNAPDFFDRDRNRTYLHCPHCDLVFVPPEFHLVPDAEKMRYEHHRHHLTDPGYRAFLERLFLPLKEKLSPSAHGLDFGCGQIPTLSILFEEAGFTCDNYDLHFANDPALLQKQYDVLTCSETIEHFKTPREEVERFLRLVKPGGWIGIMTQLRDEAPPFENWFYKNDATHLCFFSKATFHWMAKTYRLTPEFHPHGAVLFQTPPLQRD